MEDVIKWNHRRTRDNLQVFEQTNLDPEIRKIMDAVLDVERLNLIRILLEGKPLYLAEIANISSMDRATLAYHLGVLEKVGVVTSEYRILQEPRSKGKAARYYSLNHKKLDEAMKAISRL